MVRKCEVKAVFVCDQLRMGLRTFCYWLVAYRLIEPLSRNVRACIPSRFMFSAHDDNLKSHRLDVIIHLK